MLTVILCVLAVALGIFLATRLEEHPGQVPEPPAGAVPPSGEPPPG